MNAVWLSHLLPATHLVLATQAQNTKHSSQNVDATGHGAAPKVATDLGCLPTLTSQGEASVQVLDQGGLGVVMFRPHLCRASSNRPEPVWVWLQYLGKLTYLMAHEDLFWTVERAK